MGFSLNSGVVEGNLFNRREDGRSGKWKYTVAIDMSDFYYHGPTCVDAVQAAVKAGKAEGVIQAVWSGEPQRDGFWLVVLEPYHENAHPVMIAV